MIKHDLDYAEVKKLDRKIWSVALIALVAVIVLATLTHVEKETTVNIENGFPSVQLDYCEYEDSQNCYWDADVSGNGQGTSFIDVDGVAYYLP